MQKIAGRTSPRHAAIFIGGMICAVWVALALYAPASDAATNPNIYTYAVNDVGGYGEDVEYSPWSTAYPEPYANFIIPRNAVCEDEVANIWNPIFTGTYSSGGWWFVKWKLNGGSSYCDWRVGIHNGY